MSVNKAILVGNVGKAPEGKDVNDSRVANFPLATNEKIKKKDETTWHTVVCWNKLAEIVEKYLEKGSQVYVEGKIQVKAYKDKKTDETKYKNYILAQNVQFLGSPKKKEEKEGSQAFDPNESLPF